MWFIWNRRWLIFLEWQVVIGALWWFHCFSCSVGLISLHCFVGAWHTINVWLGWYQPWKPFQNRHIVMSVCILQDQDKEYVGFATLPNQVHRKSVKKGFDFTLMVAGKSWFAHNFEESAIDKVLYLTSFLFLRLKGSLAWESPPWSTVSFSQIFTKIGSFSMLKVRGPLFFLDKFYQQYMNIWRHHRGPAVPELVDQTLCFSSLPTNSSLIT